MVEIVRMEAAHVKGVAAIEAECFADPWSEASFEGELTNPLARYFAAVEEGRVIGYGGLWAVAGEGDITNIAVTARCRGRKVGLRLMGQLIACARAEGLCRLTLEVRVSNLPAKKLYERMGFRPVGLRKGYYGDNREDALLMRLELKKEEETDENFGH